MNGKKANLSTLQVRNFRRAADPEKTAKPVDGRNDKLKARALLRELQVHQEELERQNEELVHPLTAPEEVSDTYQDLFDFAPTGYFFLDERGSILRVNLAGLALLGLDRNTAVRQEFGQFMAVEYRATFTDFCRRVLTADSKQTCEVELQSGEKRRYVLMEGMLSRGVPRSLLVIVVDISERKLAQEEMRQANDHLELRVHERTAELAERVKQLRTLGMELTQTEQRERRQLAQILHDRLQQLLIVARMKVGMLRAGTHDLQFGQTIAEVDDLLRESIHESRSLAVQLYPPVLHDHGLAAGLQWLARQMHEKFHLAVDVQADPAAQPPDETTRAFLYQAVGELLLNVAKHAQARRVQVRMTRHALQPTHMAPPPGPERVCIEVRDDGVGFDPVQVAQNADGGFGMFSIRQRLELLGGHLEVRSSPGRGTLVTLRAPLRNKPSAGLAAQGFGANA